MGSNKGVVCVKLPLEIIERALSFLPVPELCRMRSVCKSWNEIIARPSFHDLCDLNGGNDEYLFMWSEVYRSEPLRVVVNPSFSDTLSFLDLEAKRWYSIPAVDLPRVCGCGHEVESRFMAVNDGLVCELTTVKACADNKFALAISDPIAKTRRSLPAPPEVFVAADTHLVSAQIVTTVDIATRSYKVFLLNNLSQYTHALRAQPSLYVHEAFTNEWRILRNLPKEVREEWAAHAVVLRKSLFILKEHNDGPFSYRLSLFRYRFQEDTWAKVYQMSFPRVFDSSPVLAVNGNRLFLNVWLGDAHSSDPSSRSDPDCPEPGSCFDANYPDTGIHFEMYEVLVADYRRKPVVRIAHAQLQQIFGNHGSERVDDSELKISYAFPCVDSNGICSSVILVSTTRCTGFQLRRYDLATGVVDVLPPHPLVHPSEEPIGEYYTVENMKLSLRNLLAQRSKELTSTGWRLLQ